MPEQTESLSGVPTEPVPGYGDLMTVESFVENVACGGFVDDDGHGDPATDTHVWKSSLLTGVDVRIYPSRVDEAFVAWCDRNGVTHVCWYNR